METLTELTTSALRILELVGVLAALLAILVALLAAVRAVWTVTARQAILVLPFRGSERSQHVAGVLAQRLPDVEREWTDLSRAIAQYEESLKGGEDALTGGPPATRTLSDALAWYDAERGKWILRAPDGEHADGAREVVADEPLDPDMIGTVTFGGFGFSPEAVLTLLHRLRAAAARRKIVGTLYEFGGSARLDATFRLARKRERVATVRELAREDELFDAVDDFAFELVKRRLAITGSDGALGTDAQTWKAYRAFLTGHASHLRFLQTGSAFDREDAIDSYRLAIESEPAYALPQYNLATLLYNRYTLEDNTEAIERFRRAARSRAPRLRALALAGLTMAYAQNVHRFEKPKEPWAFWADIESSRAYELERDLEETRFARGWAYQVLGNYETAVEWYEKVADLAGETAKARQLQSFALNNAGWVCLVELRDEKRAEEYLRKAGELYPNKIVHANLGEIHKRRGDFDAAKGEFERAIRLDPRYVNGLNEFAMLYVAWARASTDGGRSRREALLSEAASWHDRAISTVPDHGERARLHEKIAAEYKRYRFHGEARRELEEAEAERRAAAARPATATA